MFDTMWPVPFLLLFALEVNEPNWFGEYAMQQPKRPLTTLHEDLVKLGLRRESAEPLTEFRTDINVIDNVLQFGSDSARADAADYLEAHGFTGLVGQLEYEGVDLQFATRGIAERAYQFLQDLEPAVESSGKSGDLTEGTSVKRLKKHSASEKAKGRAYYRKNKNPLNLRRKKKRKSASGKRHAARLKAAKKGKKPGKNKRVMVTGLEQIASLTESLAVDSASPLTMEGTIAFLEGFAALCGTLEERFTHLSEAAQDWAENVSDDDDFDPDVEENETSPEANSLADDDDEII